MMKRTVWVLLTALSAPALADTYQITSGWTDPTTYNPGDSPTYELKWRVAAGAETVIQNLTSPAASFSVTANPGQSIEIQVMARNLGTSGPWSPVSGWVTATAGYPVTQPVEQTGITITVIRTGP